MPADRLYSAYGLLWRSCMPLPELVEIEADRPADVIIRAEPLDLPVPELAPEGRHTAVSVGEVHYYWPTIGHFLIRQGSEILIDALPDAPAEILRLILLGPALGALLHQRGYLVLHACSLEIAGQAIGFLGGSGWGKSTMAAALRERGHSLIADDVTPVRFEQDRHIVWPGFPQLKLWPEAAEALGANPLEMARLHPQEAKRGHRFRERFSTAPLPLGALYVLALGDEPAIDRLEPSAAMVELVRHSFAVRLLERSGTAGAHFQQCGQLASVVPVFKLTRPRSLPLLGRVAQMVEEHALAPGAGQAAKNTTMDTK